MNFLNMVAGGGNVDDINNNIFQNGSLKIDIIIYYIQIIIKKVNQPMGA